MRAKRPAALVAACLIIWASCAVVSATMVLFSLVMAFARDELFDELYRQQPDFDMHGLTEAQIATSSYVLTGIVLVWSLVAAVLAVLALTLVNPVLVVLLAATSVTLWLLLRADFTAWCRR